MSDTHEKVNAYNVSAMHLKQFKEKIKEIRLLKNIHPISSHQKIQEYYVRQNFFLMKYKQLILKFHIASNTEWVKAMLSKEEILKPKLLRRDL